MLKLTTVTLTVVLLAGMTIDDVVGFSTTHFTETGECQSDQVCRYKYAVEQQYFSGESQQNTSITSQVEIMCNSVGAYKGKDATLYCMRIINTTVEGSMFSDTTTKEMRNQKRFLAYILSGQFCFVQTVDGKIAAVYHTRNQSEDAINFKKTIAAAFQANFNGTEEEEEIDPQSIHVAHYIIRSSPENETIMLHRTFYEDDVIAYSTGAPKKDVKLTKEEDIEYRSGKLYHSAGHTTIKLASKGAQDQLDAFSSLFSAEGSYSLDLQQCYSLAKRAYSRHRRSVSNEMEKNGKEESLQGSFNPTLYEVRQMETIREEIPSVIDALYKISQKLNDTKTVDRLEQLLVLECKHGPLPGFSAALSDILEYFMQMKGSADPQEVAMRGIIYSLLGAEGSYQSQMVLLEALKLYAVTEEEINILINEIAMVKNPHIEFVTLFKEYLVSVSGDEEKVEPLLLSFGALASDASPEVEDFVVSYLLELETNIANAENGSTVSLFHLILAMGNTGSKLVVNSLLSYVDMSSDREIQIMAIKSLRKVLCDERVLNMLEQLLAGDEKTEDVLFAVAEVLYTGMEYSINSDSDSSCIADHPVLTSLVIATQQINNTNLHTIVLEILNRLGNNKQASSLLGQSHTLAKRGSDWDESNSLYNLVQSYSNRQSDVNSYPRHRAYIWAKEFGISQANLQVAAGVFGGVSNDCDNMKGFGKAVAKGNLLSRSTTFIDIEVLLQKTGANIRGRVYVSLGGSTLVNYDRSYTASRCYTYTRPLYERRVRIFSFSYPVYVYVGTISLVAEMHAHASVSFDASICGSASVYELATATAGLTPQIGVSLSGGVEANLLEVARGGISATGSITYQLEPRSSAKLCGISCSASYEACAGVYDSWPSNTISIETWYQTRSVEWCDGWLGIPYPCGIDWGTRHRWDAFSYEWSLGSSSRRALWESCRGTNNPQCSASPSGTRPSTPSAPPPQQSLTWPRGTYSFPKSSSGCPSGFASGCVFQDNEDNSNANSFSNTHLMSGQFGRNIQICYCTKQQSTSSSSTWPAGQYCIAKKGSCPQGFSTGELYWDDEDSGNINSISGVVPDGSYGSNTRINYCCRSDGSRSNPIRLPTTRSFILYQYLSRGCQVVSGMSHHEIRVYFDDEDNRNVNSCSGSHPYDTGCGGRNHHMYLCYYY